MVDTIESVINRPLDASEARGGMPQAANGELSNPNTSPDLTHSKVLAIEFAGKPLERREANWSGLLNAAVRTARTGGMWTASWYEAV